jgi:hypothetical protein
MRYAVMEFYFDNNNTPVFKWVAIDLSRSSAADAVKAWNYQASQKGGYMEIIEDSQSAFDDKKAEIIKYHPRLKGASYV